MLWKALRFQRLDLERGSARFSIIKGMTVLDVLESTTAYFKKREIDSPRLNAEHLLAQVLGCKRIELYLEFERDLGEAELARLRERVRRANSADRKSTRLNSSHITISYAVFCLKKKKKNQTKK